MMYNYLSLPLAIGVILFDTAIGVSLEVPVTRNSRQITVNAATSIATQITTEDSSATAQLKESNYLGLMNAGYVANQKQDYLMALNYFQQALKLQPGDSKAINAIRNVSSYGFDLYMQSGYAADRIRDYSTALQSFQKALQIRPDSWYAKQAVSNVTGYLAQQPATSSSTTNSSTDEKSSGFSIWLMLIGIGAASALSAGLLFYLFKKTGNSLQEPEIHDLEESESDETPSELPESSTMPTATDNTDRSDNHQPPKIKANSESPSLSSPLAKSVTESNGDTSITASTKSLTKLDIVPELIQDLEKSDRTGRRKAVWELAQRGDSRAMKPLVELMMEVDSQERGLILEAMTQIAGRTLKPMNKALMMSLQDDNSQVKQNAIRDLTRVYDLMSQVTKRLSQAIEDSDSQVQETAKWALKKLNQMPANATWETDNLTDEVTRIKNSSKSSNSRNGTNGTNIGKEQKFF